MAGAGELRHRISLQQRTTEVDELGERLEDWDELVVVWASIEDKRGREITDTRQLTINETSTEITIRARPQVPTGVEPEMRVVDVCGNALCAGRTFNILSIRDAKGRRREYILQAEEQKVEA